MCGRYFIDNETSMEFKKIILDSCKNLDAALFRTGEIFPTNEATILIADNRHMKPYLCKWGFPHFQNKGVIINARSETVLDKKMFRECMLERRCIIPASGFYEWNSVKNKLRFTPKEENLLYMAGLYQIFDKKPCFVILTTKANSSISDIHDRMPLLIPQAQIHSWLCDYSIALKLLNQQPHDLNRSCEWEQQTLIFR